VLERNDQTICAISTPHGTGGISVIRVSGPNALKICRKLSKKLSNTSVESHRVYFCSLKDFEGNKVDEVLFTYFENGKSFTGEETVEISCHGSPYITQQILELLCNAGAVLAERGEFTFRAFMNNKLDLVQAESVLSLIESQSKAASKVALRQLEGHISNEFEIIISELTWCLAHIEASIDFIEQGIEVVNNQELIEKLIKISNTLIKIINSYKSGRMLRDGIRVVLVGEPNVGKSSLLNLLLQSDKAIVTPIAGTTRDVIDAEVIFEGVKYNLVDTAGLRETKDQVEIIGISRSRTEAARADLTCFVLDGSSAKSIKQAIEQANNLTAEKKVFLANKADLAEPNTKNQITDTIQAAGHKVIWTSALSLDSRNQLFSAIREEIGALDFLNDLTISSARQFEQAQYSFEMISKSLAELENKMGAEFVAMYLKESLISLQKILGQVYDDQIMDRVFKEFCLGK
jgi:tRNA modification GTPase